MKLKDSDEFDQGLYIDCIDLWPDNHKLIEKVLEKSDSGAEISIKILDLPDIFN